MSLDVYLKSKEPVVKTGTGIFIRRNGKTYELSEKECEELYPGYAVTTNTFEEDYYYKDNITHNLNIMAKEADLYNPLWHPEKLGIVKAKDLIDYLREGLHKLKLEPDKYIRFNPENGWGTYESLVNFVESYLYACYKYPEAEVEVSI